MVGHNPQFTYRKDGVFYFSRRIPKDIKDRCAMAGVLTLIN